MILEFDNTSPKLDPTVFVASTAVIIGDVTMGARSSVWFGSDVVWHCDDREVGKGDG